MVSINNTLLGGKTESPDNICWNGILFWLNKKTGAKRLYHLENWDIEISGSDFIVARTTDTLSNAEMRKKGYTICEKALDVFCADGCGAFYIVAPFEDNILLTNMGSRISLWIFCEDDFTLSAQFTLSMMDKDGNIIPSPPRPQTTWENVYSYYRYSKLSNNIYDEYRWLYLVFEMIMQKVAPIGFDTVNNKPTEREGRWIQRALREADSRYSWTTAMSWPTADPVAYFLSEQYNGVRCNLFHSKGGHLQPNEHISLDVVSKRLKELNELCGYLLERIFDFSTHGTVVTYYGFSMYMDACFNNSSAFLSEHDIDPSDSNLTMDDVNPFLLLTEVPEKTVKENESVIHVYYAPFSDDKERKVRTYGIKDGEELAFYYSMPGHTLSIHDIDDVYLVHMVKLANEGDKKQHRHGGAVSPNQITI